MITASGYITSGKLHLHSRQHFIEELRQMDGQDVQVTVKRSRTRSSQQNRYYWGGVIPVVAAGLRELGVRMTAEQTHDLLKYKFCKTEIVTNDGDILETLGSTARMDTAEFSIFIEQVQQWAAEYLGIQIPDPNEQTSFDL